MLREPQHERKILNDIKITPFVPLVNSGRALSSSKDSEKFFNNLLVQLDAAKTSQIWFTQKVLLPSGGRTSKALATEPIVL